MFDTSAGQIHISCLDYPEARSSHLSQIETPAASFRLGIVGTAKNTGKTTTLVALIKHAHATGVSPAITSIGYDGEAVDNLTLLPKPRLDVFPGLVVATAERCIEQASARFETLDSGDEATSLGTVMIVRTLSEGRVLLAGPNRTDALERLLLRLQNHSPLIMIDGALGRMVPMAAADALVFATGAARIVHIPLLAEEMAATLEIFRMPSLDPGDFPDLHPETVTLSFEGAAARHFPFASLLSLADAASIISSLPECRWDLHIPGAVGPDILHDLSDRLSDAGKFCRIMVSSAPMLLAGARPIPLRDTIRVLHKKGVQVCCVRSIPVLAVTINPFYPHQHGRRGMFEPAWVEEPALRAEFTRRLDIPVINVLRDSPGAVWDAIMPGKNFPAGRL